MLSSCHGRYTGQVMVLTVIGNNSTLPTEIVLSTFLINLGEKIMGQTEMGQSALYDIIAAILLLSPVEVPTPKKVPEPLWNAAKRLALCIEIVGPHERWRDDFQAEMRYVRRHWRELNDVNTPSWYDCHRFPPASVAADHCCWNLAYQEYVKNRRWICRHQWDELTTSLEESRHLYQIWKTVQEATDMHSSWVHQRRALCKLRYLLGPEDYYVSRLPPPVPLWRFAQND
jgi:hypothetical protein